MHDEASQPGGRRATSGSYVFDDHFSDVTERRCLAALVPLGVPKRAGCPVHELEVGDVVLPSGELIVSGGLDKDDVFRYRLPPGAYPVILATDFNQNLLVAIRFSIEPVVSWSVNSSADGEAFGFSTEGGVGCFSSREALASFRRNGELEDIHEASIDLLERREQQAYAALPAAASREEASAARVRACQASPSGMLFWNVRGSDGNAIVFKLASDGFHPCYLGMTRSHAPAVLLVPGAMKWQPS
jgi:hypothetical protein